MIRFHPSQPIAFAAAFALLAVPVPVSDPVGVYALIDRVVLEPNDAAPQTIQIFGVFSFADGRSGDGYLPAERGYLYYSVNTANTRATLAEWSDMKTIAGTKSPVGFGGRYANHGALRKMGETKTNPDRYPLGIGIVKVLNAHNGPSIRYELAHVPTAFSPADGATVNAGEVKLVAGNVDDATIKYVFEIDSGSGKEVSPAIAPGNGQTSWTPKLRVAEGKSYTWRVWVVKEAWLGNIASASFRVGK